MKNKIELLKLKYDWEKTRIFGILAILVATAFGVNQAKEVGVILAIGFLMIVCIIIEIILIARIKKTIKNLREQFGENKNNHEIKEIMKESIWRKIWEPEDSHLFGELFIIIATIFLTYALTKFLPNSNKWLLLLLGLGFIFLWLGVKLIRKNKNES